MSNPKNPKIFKPMTQKKSLQFLLLGLLWLLFSIPVITCGAATCSVFYVAFKILNDEDDNHIAKLFFKGLKENFVQGLLMSIISAITIGGTGALIRWILKESDRSIVLILLALAAAFVVLVLNIFTYPMIGRYENTFGNMLRNTVALSFTYGRQTLRMTGFVAAALGIAGALFHLNILAGFISLLFWPTVIFYIISSFMAWIFYKVENPIKYDENGDPVDESQDTQTQTETENENQNENKEIES